MKTKLPTPFAAAIAIHAILRTDEPTIQPLVQESAEPFRFAADMLGWAEGADGGLWWDKVCDYLDALIDDELNHA